MRPRFAAVVFDMDGLLIDSEAIYREAWVQGALALGYSDTVAFFTSIIGVPYRDCLPLIAAHFGPDFPMDAFERTCNERLADLAADGFPLKPGVCELLDTLAQQDLPLAVATSSRRDSASRHLSGVGIAGFFTCIVGREDVARGKPHPDLYEQATRSLGSDPAKCLALEDSWTGVRAAVAAGLATVMVPDLAPPPEEANDLCLRVAADLHEVRAWLADD